MKLAILYDKNNGLSPINDNVTFGWPKTSKTLRPWLAELVQRPELQVFSGNTYKISEDLSLPLTDLVTGESYTGNLNDVDFVYMKGFGTATRKQNGGLKELETVLGYMQNNLTASSLTRPDVELRHHLGGKSYLFDLQDAGLALPQIDAVSSLDDIKYGVKQGTKILKPKQGLGGKDVYKLDANSLDEALITNLLAQYSGDLVLQDFEPKVADGERSLFFLDGEFAYAVAKIPAKGQFKANKGSANYSYHMPTMEELRLGYDVAAVMGLRGHDQYADQKFYRVDIIGDANKPQIMEVTPTGAGSTYITQLNGFDSILPKYVGLMQKAAGKQNYMRKVS